MRVMPHPLAVDDLVAGILRPAVAATTQSGADGGPGVGVAVAAPAPRARCRAGVRALPSLMMIWHAPQTGSRWIDPGMWFEGQRSGSFGQTAGWFRSGTGNGTGRLPVSLVGSPPPSKLSTAQTKHHRNTSTGAALQPCGFLRHSRSGVVLCTSQCCPCATPLVGVSQRIDLVCHLELHPLTPAPHGGIDHHPAEFRGHDPRHSRQD